LLWKFYWHIRPVTSAYYGAEIPTRTSRDAVTVGARSPSDPALGNMFTYPNIEYTSGHFSGEQPRIPWHLDMSKNWLTD